MIVGVNTHHTQDGTDFHIQIEDLSDTAELDARVYVSGRIVFSRRASYKGAILGLESPQSVEAAVQEELQRLLATLKAAIERGKITP
jgi:hypothetical protein